jgi:hypothetical protein
MAQAQQLLRMLEPLVRPGGLPAGRVQPHAPVEQQSFEQLLNEAATARIGPDPASQVESADRPFNLPDEPTRTDSPYTLGQTDRADPQAAPPSTMPADHRAPGATENRDMIDSQADPGTLISRLADLGHVHNSSVMAALGGGSSGSVDSAGADDSNDSSQGLGSERFQSET